MNNSRFMFYNHDHLGNTRLTYSTKCVAGTVNLTTSTALDYYPYGKELRAYNSSAEKYKSTHNERDLETGYDYRNARSSSSDAVRFNTTDPMESKYPSLSTYGYVGGNPVRFVDRDGQRIRFFTNIDKDFDDAEGILNTYFNNNVTFNISNAGYLEITGSNLSKLTDAQRKVYDYLNEQINAEKEIAGSIESNYTNGVFDAYNTGVFDPADVNKLNNPAEEMRLFIHFIAEQSQVISRRGNNNAIDPEYSDAHAYAVQNDFAVMGFSWANTISDWKYRAKWEFPGESRIVDTVDSNGNVIRSHQMSITEENVTKLSNIDRSSKEMQDKIKAFFSVPAPDIRGNK